MFDLFHKEQRRQIAYHRLAMILVIALALSGCNRPARQETGTIPNAAGPLLPSGAAHPSFATLPPIALPTVNPTATANQGVNQRLPEASLLPAALPQATSQATLAPAKLPPADLSPVLPTAVVPVAAPLASALQPACLVGTWEVSDLQAALERSYDQSGGSLRLQSVQGQAVYVFDANGNMTITYRDLSAVFAGQIDNRDVTASQSIAGSGSARYLVDLVNQQLIMSDYGGEGVLFTLDINGQRLAEGNLPVWQAFTSSLNGQAPPDSRQVQSSRAAVSCAGDSMTIQAVDPLTGPVVELLRVP